MNTTSTLSIATLVLAGFFTTGCSQQQVDGGGASQVAGSSQQQAEPVADVVPAPADAPAAAPHRDANSHTHPAQPKCTNSVTHTHPNGAKSHHHKYSCRGMVKHQPRRAATGNKWTHRHPAIPRCTDSVTHTHKFNNRGHHHKYSCKGAKGKGSVNVHALQRKLKAKGYYRGPINGVVTPQTRSALQRYMQNR